MPLLWDIWMSVVAGFVFSSMKPLIENKFKKEKLNDKNFFLLGLLFNQFIIVGISVWVYTEVDPNWIMLYWIDPKSIGTAVHIIYACFPFFYIITYRINKQLYEKNQSRYTLLIVASSWIIFTLIVLPDFIVIFKGNDAATHGVDYPGQFLWDIDSYPDKKPYWILPGDLRSFLMVFFVCVIVFLVTFETLGILIAWKNFYKT